MFRIKSFVFVLFTVFFAPFFSSNASAQSPVNLIPVDLMMVTSSANASSTANGEPPTDSRETQLQSINQEINFQEGQVENYKGWIQGALEDNDNIGQQIHDLDSGSENFQERLADLNEHIDSNNETISHYGEYINDSREKIAELTDKRYNIKKTSAKIRSVRKSFMR